MAGTTEYKNKWQQENRERINLIVPKGKKSIIQDHALTIGMSLNAYINTAIDEKIERDSVAQEDSQ